MYMRQTKEIRINEFLLGGMKQFIIKLPMRLGLIYYDNASKCLSFCFPEPSKFPYS